MKYVGISALTLVAACGVSHPPGDGHVDASVDAERSTDGSVDASTELSFEAFLLLYQERRCSREIACEWELERLAPVLQTYACHPSVRRHWAEELTGAFEDGTVRFDAGAFFGLTTVDPTVGFTAGFTYVFNAFRVP